MNLVFSRHISLGTVQRLRYDLQFPFCYLDFWLKNWILSLKSLLVVKNIDKCIFCMRPDAKVCGPTKKKNEMTDASW